jgi:predicted DNA-binding helix-hairpin-helix protein
VAEIAQAAPGGMLDPVLDPKLAWALANRALLPVDVNRAPREMLLRVPGFGTKTVQRILEARRHRTLRFEDLAAMGAVMGRARAFITLPGWTPRGMLDADSLRARFAPPPEQLALF